MSRLTAVLRKETIQIRRDPVLMRMLLITPLFQVLLLGYAATNDVRNVPVVIYDADRSADSRLLAEQVRHNAYFRLLPCPDDPRAPERLLLTGRAQLAVVIPRGFHRQRLRGTAAPVGLYVDGTDSNTAGVAAVYLAGLLRQQGLRWQVQQARAAGEPAGSPRLTADTRVWYNPELKSSYFMVPGVLGMILMTLTVNTAALAIVRERETGTLEQLLVTPLRPRELVVGKLAPLIVLSYVEMLVVLAFVRVWFGVPLTGSIPVLLTMSFMFLLANLGLGLVISALAKSQQEAQMVSFLLLTPSMLLSGFMFPIQNMPPLVQTLTLSIPFRWYLEIVRGVFLRGVGLTTLWTPCVVLTGMSGGLLLLGMLVLRKRL